MSNSICFFLCCISFYQTVILDAYATINQADKYMIDNIVNFE